MSLSAQDGQRGRAQNRAFNPQLGRHNRETVSFCLGLVIVTKGKHTTQTHNTQHKKGSTEEGTRTQHTRPDQTKHTHTKTPTGGPRTRRQTPGPGGGTETEPGKKTQNAHDHPRDAHKTGHNTAVSHCLSVNGKRFGIWSYWYLVLLVFGLIGIWSCWYLVLWLFGLIGT